MSSKHLYILLLLALWSCTHNFDPVEPLGEPPVATLPIEELNEWAERGEVLPEGSRIVGRVVANDLGGNFYRTMVVEDDSSAVEIHIGLYDMAALYPVGAVVSVEAEGLMVAREEGVMQLGYPPYKWSGRKVEPLADRRDIMERVVAWRVEGEPQPRSILPNEADLEMCGRLVCMDGLTHGGSAEQWGATDYGSYVEHPFVAPTGEVVLVRCSRYADFAELRIPSYELKVCGILYRVNYKGAEVPLLKIRRIDDVQKH